jgi:hypothetical protein
MKHRAYGFTLGYTAYRVDVVIYRRRSAPRIWKGVTPASARRLGCLAAANISGGKVGK